MSVDAPEESARLVEKLGLEYRVLSDAERVAISDWGLVHEGGMPGGEAIARPATYIVEPGGAISWRSLTDNYRVRVRPEHVLDALAGSD